MVVCYFICCIDFGKDGLYLPPPLDILDCRLGDKVRFLPGNLIDFMPQCVSGLEGKVNFHQDFVCFINVVHYCMLKKICEIYFISI